MSSKSKRAKTHAGRSAFKSSSRTARNSLIDTTKLPRGSDRKTVKIRYADTFQLNTSTVAGAISAHYFSANSIYDPDVTGTGHQPYGFDSYKLFHNHYTVTNAKINVKFMSNYQGSENVLCVVRPLGLAAVTTDGFISTQQENPGAVWGHIGPNQGGQPHCLLSKNLSIKDYFNVKGDIVQRSQLTSLFSTNPAEMCYFGIFTSNTGTALTAALVTVQVTIDYEVVFSESKSLDRQ